MPAQSESAYLRPTRTDEALKHLARRPLTILAGGTDYYAARVGKPLTDSILDITAIGELRTITENADHWRIGATTTWSDILAADLPPMFDCLKLAAREVGGVQIQNSGTVAGNICNASPAADGVPALLALDAAVELASAQGTRSVPMDDFIQGPRKTVRRPDELVAAVVIPKPPHDARSHFLKLGARRYLVISISMVAVVIEHERGKVQRARISVGSCSAVARRMLELEFALAGEPFDARLAQCVRRDHLGRLGPLDDVRGSAEYRMDATLTLLKRMLVEVAS
jgi:CO/xanthine dehydrogenase FAD-binding subunit